MYSVVITHQETKKVVAQVAVSLRGMNYTPSPAEYHAEAWKIAIDDNLIEAGADKHDYVFEIQNVAVRDVFSGRW